MADARKLSRQRVLCPTDGTLFVDIPCIDQAIFSCGHEQFQEYRWFVNNKQSNQNRTVHTHRVFNHADNTQYVDVERIDLLHGKVAQAQAQDFNWFLKNQDPPPQPAELVGVEPMHRRVHYVRYYQNNDTSKEVWIDVELIDEVKIKCAHEQAQEYVFYLKHPPLGDPPPSPADPQSVTPDPYAPYLTVATCDQSLPLLGGQSPWRFDPFQNIVNVNWRNTEPGEGLNIVWIQAAAHVSNTPIANWGISWFEAWGATLNSGYPYLGDAPFQDALIGNFTITWSQYNAALGSGSEAPLGFEAIIPELHAFWADWAYNGGTKDERPNARLTIEDDTDGP